MQPFINIADLKDPDDPQGRSYRQVNAEKQHNIPLRTLVEVQPDEDSQFKNGIRLFVMALGRDCDMTPLYWLGPDQDEERQREGFANPTWIGGFPESSLTVIESPE